MWLAGSFQDCNHGCIGEFFLLAALTAPASLLVFALAQILTTWWPSSGAALDALLGTSSPTVGAFLVSAVSGGLNAILIFVLWSAIQRCRHRRDSNLEKNWEARFADHHAGRTTRAKIAKIAAGYWIVVLLVFFAMQLAGFEMSGHDSLLTAFLLAALTAPAGLLVFALAMSGAFESLLRPLALLGPLSPTIQVFLVLPVVCGGLNAIFIFVLLSAIQRLRHRSR
jgi:hypothetical protein